MPRSNEPSGTSSRIVYCTGSTLPTSPCTATNWRIARTSSSVAHGVNGNHDGRIAIPWPRRSSTARPASAAVWPLSRSSRVASLTDSNADTTKMHPDAANSSHTSACWRMCSTLTVQSNVRWGNRSCTARTTRSAWCTPLKKSGSP